MLIVNGKLINKGDDVTVSINGTARVASYGKIAKPYLFCNTIVKLRVLESFNDMLRSAKLPKFLCDKIKEHWGNTEIRGYNAEKLLTYFLDNGTYSVLNIETYEDRLKLILNAQNNNKRFGFTDFPSYESFKEKTLLPYYNQQKLGK